MSPHSYLFSGTIRAVGSVWVQAESEEEALDKLENGEWEQHELVEDWKPSMLEVRREEMRLDKVDDEIIE